MAKSKKLRIAIVAPPFGDIGGPEMVAKNLADALSERSDVEVVLFAPADWKTNLKHIPTLEKSLWNMKDFKKQPMRIRRNLIIESQIKALFFQDKLDLIHLHSSTFAYNVGRFSKIPCVLSFHNIINAPEYNQLRKAGIKLISLSKHQKQNYKTEATIWNGVPVKSIGCSTKKGEYLIFIGRLCDQKGVDRAIKIALRSKKKLFIFGRIGNSPERIKYFREQIAPHLDEKKIIYRGEVSNKKILSYLKSAGALIFPIRRHEVCPMVIAESLACGTPIIGSMINPLPELIGRNKKIALLSENLNDLVSAAKNTDQFDRSECRRYAENNFDSTRMAEKYFLAYKKILRQDA